MSVRVCVPLSACIPVRNISIIISLINYKLHYPEPPAPDLSLLNLHDVVDVGTISSNKLHYPEAPAPDRSLLYLHDVVDVGNPVYPFINYITQNLLLLTLASSICMMLARQSEMLLLM